VTALGRSGVRRRASSCDAQSNAERVTAAYARHQPVPSWRQRLL